MIKSRYFTLITLLLSISTINLSFADTSVVKLADTTPYISNAPDSTTITPALNTADIWDRIRSGFGMDTMDSPLVTAQVNWYAQRPDYVRRTVERSRRYLYHILGEVEKRGMPTEIALLPMIESAFNPMAYSPSHASGIWQFIPSTGKDFGLKQNGWYDGRRDIIAATGAALDYLNKLHDQFGTWELALAAYNCGEGCVGRAIAKNQAQGLPTDYLSLNLPMETRNYVPKLLAVKQIIADPASVGINLNSIPDQAYFTKVMLDKSIDVNLAAKLANMPVNEFISLNPAFNKPVVRSDSNTQLLLPVDKVATFSQNLASYDKPLVSWQAYTAKIGERISSIAKKFNVSVAWIKEHNPIHLSNKGKLTSDHTLLVPLASTNTAATMPIEKIAMNDPVPANKNDTKNTPSTDSSNKKSDPPAHKITVKKGETLHSLATRHHVNVTELESWNHIKHHQLKLGQSLIVSEPAQAKNSQKDEPAHTSKRDKHASTKADKKAKTASKKDKSTPTKSSHRKADKPASSTKGTQKKASESASSTHKTKPKPKHKSS
ncbi:MAG: transglycosylase SLT domain-containing protein [Sulfuriferula sp.]|nr:transglycosylase SLT domain-containing protein [Sulfuriferula sp.]